MLTVIIADDEKKIVNMLLHLIDWEKEGYQVIGTANNGQDAYSLILNLKPNIALLDMRMPGYDGIELIKRIQREGLNVEFIVISGYQHFEYAHNALNLGVCHYLLKPIDEDDLRTALRKTAEKFNEQFMQKDDRITLRGAFLERLISDTEQVYDEYSVNKIYRTDFSNGHFKVLWLHLVAREYEETGIRTLLEKFVLILQKKIGEYCKEHIEVIRDENVIQLINYEYDELKMKSMIQDTFREVQEICSLYEGFRVFLGIGRTVDSFSLISSAMVTARETMAYKLVDKKEIIEYEPNRFQDYPIRQIFTAELEKRLLGEIELRNIAGIKETMDIIYKRLSECQNINPARLYDLVLAVSEVADNCYKMNNSGKGDFPAKWQTKYRHHVYTTDSFEILYQIMVDYVIQSAELIYQDKVAVYKRPVRLTRRYIEEHYSEKITVDSLAKKVNLNNTYLSTLFKKEFGLGIAEYVINCRIEAAKDLLIETDDCIEIIAEKVGYSDVKHFSKQFKKMTQMKPSDYRKLFS